MQLGIIGTGYIATELMENKSYFDKLIQVTGVISRKMENAIAFSEKYGIQNVYQSFEAMLEQVDAVYIATQNDTHYHYSKMALQKGIHVLCEKPIVVEVSELEELWALSEEKGLIYMEAMRTLDLPVYTKAKELIFEQKIGQIVSIEGSLGRISSRLYRHTPALAGGALMDLGIYPIYAMVDILGVPTDIQSSAVMLDSGVDGAVSGILKYDSALGFFNASCISQTRCDLRICGKEGTIVIPKHFTLASHLILENKDGTVKQIDTDILGNGMAHEIITFYNMVENNNQGEARRRLVLSKKVLSVISQIRSANGILCR